MITKYKNRLEPLVAIIAQPFLHFHPNTITLLGLIFPILFLIFLTTHLYILGLLCCIGFVMDAIDGYVARKQVMTSSFGKVLDSTVDRASDSIVISAFGFAHLVPWYLVIAALISTSLVSYSRTRAEAVARTDI